MRSIRMMTFGMGPKNSHEKIPAKDGVKTCILLPKIELKP